MSFILFAYAIAIPWPIVRNTLFYNLISQSFSAMSNVDAHTTDDVDYKWRKTESNKGKGIEVVSQAMAQFELAGIETKLKDTENSKGNFTIYLNIFVYDKLVNEVSTTSLK